MSKLLNIYYIHVVHNGKLHVARYLIVAKNEVQAIKLATDKSKKLHNITSVIVMDWWHIHSLKENGVISLFN